MSANSLRILFAGTPAFAAHHLAALLQAGHQVVGVYTQPDRPAGRGKRLSQSAVKQLASLQGLPVHQPLSLKDLDAQKALATHNADVMVVVAYGLLLPEAVLNMPRYGCINVHGSLLPRWRGAAPIQRAIASGDSETGITTMQMDKGLDTGNMLALAHLPIAAGDTSASLHDKLMVLGATTLLNTLEQLAAGKLAPIKQDDSQATYADKITKAEAEINWSQPSATIERLIRAYNPFPIAYTTIGSERLKIYQASFNDTPSTQGCLPGTIIDMTDDGIVVACGEGQLTIQTAQLPGKKPLSARELVNGHRAKFVLGHRLA